MNLPILHMGQHSPADDLYSVWPQAFPNANCVRRTVRNKNAPVLVPIAPFKTYMISCTNNN